MRSAEQFNAAKRMIAAGMNDCAIARELGIPRPTIQDWRCRPQVRPRSPAGSTACGVDHDFAALPAAPYAYLLGLYLGDGCIYTGPTSLATEDRPGQEVSGDN